MEMFAERLERLIKENNLTQSSLADMVKIRRPTISDWKKNGSYPTADVAVAIAKVLHTSVEYLVTGVEQKQDNTETIELLNKAIQKLS